MRRPPISTCPDTLLPNTPLVGSNDRACAGSVRPPIRRRGVHARAPDRQRLPRKRGTACPAPYAPAARCRTGCASLTEQRSEEHTSELQSLMRISYAVFCLKKKNEDTHKYNK